MIITKDYDVVDVVFRVSAIVGETETDSKFIKDKEYKTYKAALKSISKFVKKNTIGVG